MGDLLKVDSHQTEALIQSTRLRQGWSIPPNGGSGGLNDNVTTLILGLQPRQGAWKGEG
jgi:hypothetical protein